MVMSDLHHNLIAQYRQIKEENQRMLQLCHRLAEDNAVLVERCQWKDEMIEEMKTSIEELKETQNHELKDMKKLTLSAQPMLIEESSDSKDSTPPEKFSSLIDENAVLGGDRVDQLQSRIEELEFQRLELVDRSTRCEQEVKRLTTKVFGLHKEVHRAHQQTADALNKIEHQTTVIQQLVNEQSDLSKDGRLIKKKMELLKKKVRDDDGDFVSVHPTLYSNGPAS